MNSPQETEVLKLVRRAAASEPDSDNAWQIVVERHRETVLASLLKILPSLEDHSPSVELAKDESSDALTAWTDLRKRLDQLDMLLDQTLEMPPRVVHEQHDTYLRRDALWKASSRVNGQQSIRWDWFLASAFMRSTFAFLMLIRCKEDPTNPAWDWLVGEYASDVEKVLRSEGLDNDADIAVQFQEIWFKVIKWLPTFRFEHPFAASLKIISKRTAKDYWRRRRKDPLVKTAEEHAGDEPNDDGLNLAKSPSRGPDELLDWDLQRELVDKVISQLDEPLRSTFRLWHKDEHDYNTMARMLGVAIGVVASRVSRAKEELRRLYLKTRADMIEKAIVRLDDFQKTILELWIAGNKQEAIAKKLRVDNKSVGEALSQINKILRKILFGGNGEK